MGLETKVENVANHDDIGGLEGASPVEFDFVQTVDSKTRVKQTNSKFHKTKTHLVIKV